MTAGQICRAGPRCWAVGTKRTDITPVKGFMTATMNPFMIPAEGFTVIEWLRRRPGASQVSTIIISAPKHRRSRRLAALRRHHRAAEQGRRTSLVNRTDRLMVKATKYLIKGFMMES
jgi:hypothetical protein